MLTLLFVILGIVAVASLTAWKSHMAPRRHDRDDTQREQRDGDDQADEPPYDDDHTYFDDLTDEEVEYDYMQNHQEDDDD